MPVIGSAVAFQGERDRRRDIAAARKPSIAADIQRRKDIRLFGEAERGREFQAAETGKAFERKAGFAREMLGKFQAGDAVSGAELQGPSESEQLLIQAQEEAGEKDVNRLQDILSGAGILSSGTLAVGTGEILGSARAGVARTAAGFAESRLTRRHQRLLAKRQQLTQLISSILV